MSKVRLRCDVPLYDQALTRRLLEPGRARCCWRILISWVPLFGEGTNFDRGLASHSDRTGLGPASSEKATWDDGTPGAPGIRDDAGDLDEDATVSSNSASGVRFES